MNWPDSISEALPPPRDDEPSSLRDDIADELADHLEAAFARERSRCDDDTAARKAVLHRFGDPTSIGRRLWFDAMKGKIMLQRFALIVQSALAACCLAALALLWNATRQSERANKAIVSQLVEVAAALKRDSQSAFAELHVRCVNEGAGGEPMRNVSVSLWGDAVRVGEQLQLNGATDETGIARFHSILPGKYQLIMYMSGGRSLDKQVVLLPGSNEERIAYSPEPIPLADINIDVEWPRELRGKDVAVVAALQPEKFADSSGWRYPMSEAYAPLDAPWVVLDGSGNMLRGLTFEEIGPIELDHQIRYPRSKQQWAPPEVHWLATNYRLERLLIVQRVVDEEDQRYAIATNLARFEYETPKQQVFEATMGKVNHWTIQVPPTTAEGWEQSAAMARLTATPAR